MCDLEKFLNGGKHQWTFQGVTSFHTYSNSALTSRNLLKKNNIHLTAINSVEFTSSTVIETMCKNGVDGRFTRLKKKNLSLELNSKIEKHWKNTKVCLIFFKNALKISSSNEQFYKGKLPHANVKNWFIVIIKVVQQPVFRPTEIMPFHIVRVDWLAFFPE